MFPAVTVSLSHCPPTNNRVPLWPDRSMSSRPSESFSGTTASGRNGSALRLILPPASPPMVLHVCISDRANKVKAGSAPSRADATSSCRGLRRSVRVFETSSVLLSNAAALQKEIPLDTTGMTEISFWLFLLVDNWGDKSQQRDPRLPNPVRRPISHPEALPQSQQGVRGGDGEGDWVPKHLHDRLCLAPASTLRYNIAKAAAVSRRTRQQNGAAPKTWSWSRFKHSLPTTKKLALPKTDSSGYGGQLGSRIRNMHCEACMPAVCLAQRAQLGSNRRARLSAETWRSPPARCRECADDSMESERPRQRSPEWRKRLRTRRQVMK